jgi:hypothetical protein
MTSIQYNKASFCDAGSEHLYVDYFFYSSFFCSLISRLFLLFKCHASTVFFLVYSWYFGIGNKFVLIIIVLLELESWRLGFVYNPKRTTNEVDYL